MELKDMDVAIASLQEDGIAVEKPKPRIAPVTISQESLKRDIKTNLKAMFEKNIKYSNIQADGTDVVFRVRTLDSRHYLDGDLKLFNQEDASRDVNSVMVEMFKYFVRALISINDVPVEEIIELPKTDPAFYGTLEKYLKDAITGTAIIDILSKYAAFFSGQDLDQLQKKTK